MRKRSTSSVRPGQTLRISVSSDDSPKTVLVLNVTSNDIRCRMECGDQRGTICNFEIAEIYDCVELFGSSILKSLYEKVQTCKWSKANKSNSKEIPSVTPKLKTEFMVPPNESFKRK